MIESEFWEQLRARINSSDAARSSGYCDWIEPRRYLLGSSEACIMGRIGFVALAVNGYTFRLALPEHIASLAEIDWIALLPKQDAQEWITIEHHRVVISTMDDVG